MSASKAHTIGRVGIVGGGIMGTGIAEVCARAGLSVKLLRPDPATSRSAPSGATESPHAIALLA
ncbi:MAG: 3-hydroxyacyl-CoA dehydrogenase NAD-binding domain-containing protein [Solirubrobacteraceae bacterium]